jgi:hypothetical protein
MKSLAILALSLAPALAADVTGTWNMAVELSVGSGNPTVVLKQQGEKLTGTYTGTLGEAPVSGKIEEDKIEFWFEAEAGGQKLRVTYKGVVKNGNSMQGTVDYSGVGDGTFTGRKKE